MRQELISINFDRKFFTLLYVYEMDAPAPHSAEIKIHQHLRFDTHYDKDKGMKKNWRSAIQSRFASLRKFKKPGKHMFWAWIAYQSVKGTLTLSLIWIPLAYAWLHAH